MGLQQDIRFYSRIQTNQQLTHPSFPPRSIHLLMYVLWFSDMAYVSSHSHFMASLFILILPHQMCGLLCIFGVHFSISSLHFNLIGFCKQVESTHPNHIILIFHHIPSSVYYLSYIIASSYRMQYIRKAVNLMPAIIDLLA